MRKLLALCAALLLVVAGASCKEKGDKTVSYTEVIEDFLRGIVFGGNTQ